VTPSGQSFRHTPILKVKEHYMTTVVTRPGPNGRAARPSLSDQLDRLDGILNGLADALNQSVAAAVTAAVGKAVREAVEAATRELAARPTPPVAALINREAVADRKPHHRIWDRVRAMTRRTPAWAGCTAVRPFRRLWAPAVVLVQRMKRSPRRFVAAVFSGIVAGVVAGICGPVIGAAFGGLVCFVSSLSATT
jgi:hypothetical protein